ncbi:hypothetical protein VMCG_10248 [Cytospora schulzeri]|uniref:Heterokaryon incompatibility domain-containing protein n=1 Tax=Cytospora schulzeri TaxID=448051 RepID=A0A423VGS9_9PEZI|nr:hypothetical protein VMCG_10248 [Valsa malicola]
MSHAPQEHRIQEGPKQDNNQELDTRGSLKALAISDDHDSRDQPVAIPSPREWPGECKICRQVWQLFSQPERTCGVDWGSFGEALATQCLTHKPLVQACSDHLREIFLTSPEEWGGGPEKIRIARDHAGAKIKLYLSRGYDELSLLLVKKDSVPHHPGTGRILNPDWVDLDMLQEWKKQCLSTHGAKCENPLKIWPTRPAYLIDVKSKCLVSGQVSGAFVALSYRYGRSSGTTIDAATLERLQKPYALDSVEFKQHLSPIIRDAMYLTAVISERYLWADALCIPQADQALKNEELNMMGAIYANAVVTIIAADGDSQDGLPGLEGVSEPRMMNQRIIPFGNETLILHWQCQCGFRHEETILNAEIGEYIDPWQSVLMAGFPDLGSLSRLLYDFSHTKLRYDEDALPAISGFLSVLSRSFTGGFLYGIPEMFFERGLGWRPKTVWLRRRTLSERPVEDRLSPSGLPSWSWIGWQGDINLCHYKEAYKLDKWEPIIEETIPITEWYTSNSSNNLPEDRRRIRSTWFENRDTYKDLAQPLPPGWSRHDAPDMGTSRGLSCLYPDDCGKYVFRHADMHGPDRKTTWYYPFPIPEILDSTPPVTPEQTPYLFCRTWRAQLWGRQASERNTVRLHNRSGRDVGFLHPHNKESMALFPGTDSEAGHRLSVELVAVYKSRRYSKTWNEESRTLGHPLAREDWHTVLWIEWKDGVAYRLASGEVKTEEWEKLDTESFDLVLG